MTNKTLGWWLLATLIVSIGLYLLGADDGTIGLVVIANWVFQAIGSTRLIKQ
jgi:hypothetical protein